MKRIILSSVLFCTMHFGFGQIPNADLEQWDNAPLLLQWETNSRPQTLPPWDPYIVRRDTDSYSGNFAANLWANGIFKAYAKTTFPIVYHPQNLSLYYKLVFAPCVNDSGFAEKDTASVLVEVLSNGTVVDQGYWESISNNTAYTQLIIPVSQNSSAFDSCRITMMGGKVIGGCGGVAASTEFKVDHLELKYSAQDSCIDSSQICLSCRCIALYDPVCGCDGHTYSNSCVAYIAGVTSWTAGACGSINWCIDSSQICPTCVCPLIYDPVCGCDGITYSNTCFAYNAGVISWTQGVCGTGPCRADFIYSGNPIVPAVIQYQDISNGANITGWDWTFSDGTSSNQQNPLVTYTVPGTYSACLRITSVDTSGSICLDSVCQSIMISDTASGCIDSSLICDTCVCPAIYNPVCGCNGITYDNNCMAQNSGVISWTPGPCGIVTPCEAYFYYWADTSGYIVNFEYASGWIPIPGNTSQLLLWDFGDSTSSTDMQPVHHYSDTSIHSYLVCLTVTDTSLNCTTTYCDSVYVGRFIVGCYAGFGYTIDSGGVVVVYPDSSSGFISGGTWTVGDSVYSTPDPVVLDSTNSYNICFVVRNDSLGCVDTVCINSLQLYAEYLAMGVQKLNKDLNRVYLFPNPTLTNAELHFILVRSGWMGVSVKNMLGEVVYQLPGAKISTGAYSIMLNTASLNRGVYLVELKLDGSTAAVLKLVRQ